MPLIIEFIQGLIQKEAAYAAPNGDVYFSVISDDDYGKLSGRKLEDMQAGARIEVEEAKDHPMDFALWKAAKPGEISWDSPWGKGRPGWHIECSAMNLAELGEQIDIHGGGNDLIFPHHENEIAQTESYTGKQFRPLLGSQRHVAARRREDVQVVGQHRQHQGLLIQARCRCDADARLVQFLSCTLDLQ